MARKSIAPLRKMPKTFGVSVRKAGRIHLVSEIVRPPAIPTVEQAEEQPGLINGVQATNKYEWRAAQALWQAGLEFDYQVSVLGGRALRGGQVIDMVVHTAPLFTPLFIDGEHWHEGRLAKEDVVKRLVLQEFLGDTMNLPVVFFGPDLFNVQAARDAVRREFRQ